MKRDFSLFKFSVSQNAELHKYVHSLF